MIDKRNITAVLNAGEITTRDKYGNEVVLTQDTGKDIYKLMCSIFGKKGGFPKGRKRGPRNKVINS